MKIFLITILFSFTSHANDKALRDLTRDQLSKSICGGTLASTLMVAYASKENISFKKPLISDSTDKDILKIYEKIKMNPSSAKNPDSVTVKYFLEIYDLLEKKKAPFAKECLDTNNDLGKNCYDLYKNGTKEQADACGRKSGVSEATLALLKKHFYLKK